MDMSQYLGVFLDECREHLQHLNECLLKLEAREHSAEDLRSMFRAAHTIKGAAATMGFTQMAELTHQLETILGLVQKNEIVLTAIVIDGLFKALDVLENMVFAISEGNELVDEECREIVVQLKGLENVQKNLKSTKTEMDSVKINGDALESANFVLNIKIDSNCQLKLARAMVVLTRLHQLGNVVCTVPDLSANPSLNDGVVKIYLNSEADSEKIKTTVLDIPEIASISVSDARSEKQDDGKTTQVRFHSSSTVRVDISRLDHLMNLVSELVIHRTRLTQLAFESDSRELKDTVDRLNRSILEMQDLVMKVRMVPIENTFNRFPRAVRDLAQKLSKDVKLVLKGKETELDRTIIDELGEPLLHMVRNAIDHGFELPQEREIIGKSRTGTLTLSAYQKGDNVYIEIEDDGKGIDVNRIRSKAMSRSLISQSEAESMTDYDHMQMMFRPGFSTAEKVSDVSGRGVGLDVVKTKIEALGGKVEVHSSFGAGTRFVISLPLTLAIISVLLVNVSNCKYALPLGAVEQTALIQPEDVKVVQGQPTMRFQGTLIPIFKLTSLLGNAEYEYESDAGIYVLIVKKDNRFAGLIVDDILGQEDIVIKPLGRFVDKIPGVTGATVLGNGQIALMLDVAYLL